jgi:hypothetical protein
MASQVFPALVVCVRTVWSFVGAGEPDRILVLSQLLTDNDFASLGSLAEADEPGTWEGVDALRGGECAFLDRLRLIAKRFAVLPSPASALCINSLFWQDRLRRRVWTAPEKGVWQDC